MAAPKNKDKSHNARARSSTKKPPISVLSKALHSLPASGEAGFEGLIANLLTKFTGVPFLVRRSGSQQGRDVDSSVNAAECIFVECKRYEESSALDERGLRTQIEISINAAPELDMWVLATTRSVDASATEWLEKKTRERGADFYVLSCGSPTLPADLDYLAAAFADDVVTSCEGANIDSAVLHAYLRKLGESSGFENALARMKTTFSSATVGLPTFRTLLNESLRTTLESEATSRLRLNAPLASGEFTPINVPRLAVQEHLHSFASPTRSRDAPRICVIQGDEGNGKSWAVATWVRGLISQQSAPPVFWFKASASKELGIRDLSRLAVTHLQTSEENVFTLKLQRWLGTASDVRGVVVLDGINERHSFQFWTDYIANLLAEVGPNVLLVITCRADTWRRQLKPRLTLKSMEFDLSEFNEQEFGIAMCAQPREIIERLWDLGPVARKPRYLADALAYLHQGGDASELTVEMLQYHGWKNRYRTRADYPVAPHEFENVLKHLAREMSQRVAAGELKDLLIFNPHAVEAMIELASGGVLRHEGTTISLERPYLVEGLSLLLIDALTLSAGTVAELRQQIGHFVHDTQRTPLTAEICASAAYKALSDEKIRNEVAVALSLEFLDCQNAAQTSVEGIIALASKRPYVISQIAESLWSVTGVDSTVEQMVLRGLIQIAQTASPQDAIVNILARWSGFIHEHGEFYHQDAGDHTDRVSASVTRVAPTIGRVELATDGSIALTRVENQRLLRLSRLALAVISLADRRTFFEIAFNSLIGDSVMLTSRGGISGWILGSSRFALRQQITAALKNVDMLSFASSADKRRVRRILFESAADPAFASQLRAARLEAQEAMRNEPLLSPRREEFPAFLRRADVGFHAKIRTASTYASDPTFEYPDDFVSELRTYSQNFPVARRRVSIGQTAEDHEWRFLEPLLCRLCPDAFENLTHEFIRSVEQRDEHSIYPWLFAADGYVCLFDESEIELVSQARGRLLAHDNETDKLKTIEFSLFGMLLARMSPPEQIQRLLLRGNSRAHLGSYTNEFHQLASAEAQEQIASLAITDDQLMPVLWYGIEQHQLVSAVWLPLIDRALQGLSGIGYGCALQLLFQMPEQDVLSRLDQLRLEGEPTHFEKHWFTRILLQHSIEPPSTILDRCDLATCAEVLGMVVGKERQQELATAFAGRVIAWLRLQIDPESPPSPELRVIIQTQSPDRGGFASVSLDEEQFNNSVSFRSELSSWGGLEQGSGADMLSEAFSDRRLSELQNALRDAMRRTSEHGNWAYTTFWSDSTINLMLDNVAGFKVEVYAAIEYSIVRKRLRAIGGFVSAIVRTLLNVGNPEGLWLLRTMREEDVTVRSIDGSTGWDLLDMAISSYPQSDDASELWLERIDSSQSDAYVFANCEQLVKGGNRKWLLSQAERDLSSDAPYYRRRGLILLAGSGCCISDLETAALALGNSLIGLESAMQTAVRYVESFSRMRRWLMEMLRAEHVSQAKCAALLLLHCVDSRIWTLLIDTVAEHGEPRSGAPLTHLLPYSDLKKGVRETLKDRDKFLFGYNKAKNDAAPWLQLGTDMSIHLSI